MRSNGERTYFASDTAYYIDKRARGFDLAIYLLGADHHGYVGRLKTIAACAGDDPEQNIEILIGQLVKILKGGAEVRSPSGPATWSPSPTSSTVAGVDAVRYSLARCPVDSPLVLDIDRDHQAHQRQPGVLRAVRPCPHRQRCSATPPRSASRSTTFDAPLLDHPTEAALLTALGDFPRVVAHAAELREPHRVARYLEDLAGDLPPLVRRLPGHPGRRRPDHRHQPHPACGSTTRPAPCSANGLELLGVGAPERM